LVHDLGFTNVRLVTAVGDRLANGTRELLDEPGERFGIEGLISFTPDDQGGATHPGKARRKIGDRIDDMEDFGRSSLIVLGYLLALPV
jgi:hypothetical protein